MKYMKLFESYVTDIISKVKEFEATKKRLDALNKELNDINTQNVAMVVEFLDILDEQDFTDSKGGGWGIDVKIKTPKKTIYRIEKISSDHSTIETHRGGIDVFLKWHPTKPEGDLLWNLRDDDYDTVLYLLDGLFKLYPDIAKKMEAKRTASKFDM